MLGGPASEGAILAIEVFAGSSANFFGDQRNDLRGTVGNVGSTAGWRQEGQGRVHAVRPTWRISSRNLSSERSARAWGRYRLGVWGARYMWALPSNPKHRGVCQAQNRFEREQPHVV